MIETEDTIKKILSAMGLPCSFGALSLPTLPLPHAASPRQPRSFISRALHACHPGTRAGAMTG